jgi:hypothetical protein
MGVPVPVELVMDYRDPDKVAVLVEESIANLEMANLKLAQLWETLQSPTIEDARADIEQAIRWLRGEEEPS